MTDDQLLRRMQSGQQAALEQLMEKYRRYVYTVIANILGTAGTPDDAEELTQDAFYAVWTHAGAISRGGLKPYLSAAARNRAKDFLRARREMPMDLDTLQVPDPGDSLEEAAARRELQRKVRATIGRMRPRDREVFLRYYYYLQPTEEIARQMGLSPGTVRSRLARGRKKLKDILSKEVEL